MGSWVSSATESESKAGASSSDRLSRDLNARRWSRRRETIDFDVEAWYKIFEKETFYTEFLPISPPVGQAFVDYYQARYNAKHSLFTADDVRAIQSIENQLKERVFNLEANPWMKDGAFVRMSCRSPKDGDGLHPQRLKELYQQELNRLSEQYPLESSSSVGRANLQMIAFCQAQGRCLRVTNESETLNLILSSERVFVDLLDALACQTAAEPEENVPPWRTNLIVRQWSDHLDPSMEFRCFVYQSHLTAISQYNHYCKFAHLQDPLTVERIKSTIVNYYRERIEPLVAPYKETYSNYIIDIGLTETSTLQQFQCIVIELNPFAKSTGASLFHWTMDLEQLTGKTSEVEVRVRTEYYPNITDYIDMIFQQNDLNDEQKSSNDAEPYFVFLQRIKALVSS